MTSSSSPSSLSLGIETVLGFWHALIPSIHPSIHPDWVEKRHSDIQTQSRKIDFQRVAVGGGDAPRNRCHRKGISLVVGVCLSCSQRESNSAFQSSDVWLARLNHNTSRERSTYAINRKIPSRQRQHRLLCAYFHRETYRNCTTYCLLSPWLLDSRDLPFHSESTQLFITTTVTQTVLRLNHNIITINSGIQCWGNAAEDEEDG